MRQGVKRIFNKLGYNLSKGSYGFEFNQMKLLNEHKINLVFDIGASVGNYGIRLRKEGYKGRIVSFEPIKSSYDKLVLKSEKDSGWESVNKGIGNREEIKTINISGNMSSSSFLDMAPIHLEASPNTGYVSTEEAQITTLDKVFNDYYKPQDSVFVKIDVQGFEKRVLDGLVSSIKNIRGIQIELSLVPTYEDGGNFIEIIKYLNTEGFNLVFINPVLINESTGQMLQIDALLFR